MPGRPPLRVALEIDEHVEPVLRDDPRRRVVVELAQVPPRPERALQALAHRSAVVAVERIGERRHARAVVALEEARGEIGGGVLVEVRER